MELKVVRTRTTETVVTVEKEWSIEANVTMQDGKIENIEGSVAKTEAQPVRFTEYRYDNGQTNRTVQGVTDETTGAYDLVNDVVDAVVAKYKAL